MILGEKADFEPGSAEDLEATTMVLAEDFARFLFRLPPEKRQAMMEFLSSAVRDCEAEEQASSRRAA